MGAAELVPSRQTPFAILFFLSHTPVVVGVRLASLFIHLQTFRGFLGLGVVGRAGEGKGGGHGDEEED